VVDNLAFFQSKEPLGRYFNFFSGG